MKYIKTLILSLFVVAGALAFSQVAFAQTYYQYNTNRVPFFISQPVTTATVGEGYVYGARAQDPDANSITYVLTQAPAGMAINPVTHVIVWTPSQAGTYAVTVSVYDYTNVYANQS